MGGTVVEELSDGDGECFSAVGLGVCERRAKSDEHGAIDGVSIVEKGADDVLELGEALASSGGEVSSSGAYCMVEP